ncbi:protein D2-like [Paramacrobiotus metropolitanus]|uniref:protein D2-like n=1 Tax=Paramacrobiotus metropolitanus TaxID=2943436 RepID=UPI002445C119|nr:protein D2-like [Paramacrobiotus metropolitanus]XP_055353171.1 protein D2-like [Paramacrobiotus metropolitanus]
MQSHFSGCWWILFLSCASAVQGVNQNVAERFSKGEVVPDLVDKAPQEGLMVTYTKGKEVNFGNELKPEDTEHQPNVAWLSRDSDLFTISMSDLDVPNRENPVTRSINHWLVINVKKNDLSSGDVIQSYRGPHPPKGSGLHRYVQLVYKQTGRIDKNSLPGALFSDRRKFSIKNFAKEHNLGDPFAGNYYVAQYDGFFDRLPTNSSA